MKRFSLLILVFSIAFLVFFFGPPFLSKQFGPYPLMKVGDVFDLFTPLVLIPLYWALYRLDERPLSVKSGVVFMILVAFWVLGQGMHLAANSIGHLLVDNMKNTAVYDLTNFYDEVLSHYLWHFGVIALSAALIYRHWKNPLKEGNTRQWVVTVAGLIYGFAYFGLVIEGATTPLGVLFAFLAAIFILIWGQNNLKQQPVLSFFLVAYLLAAVLFLVWGIYWHGLPEFSEVGIIN
jgi:hypothetical protein